MDRKLVYFFSAEYTDECPEGKEILGGKGDGLSRITQMGLPVPPGFTISTEQCEYFYNNNQKYHPQLEKEVLQALSRLEKVNGKEFGKGDNPLLVSVRSGAAMSMPGMMDTILNLGLNDVSVESLAHKTQNPRFAYDSYRRFIQMFANVVNNLSEKIFDDVLEKYKKELHLENDSELTTEALKSIVTEFKQIYKQNLNEDFPQDVYQQLWGAIKAVFLSWNSKRAIAYRKMNHIHGLKGTAVNICTMVFGNMGEDSGTGVAFTRNPSTGDKEIFGEFLPNAQGEDIVAGTRTPYKISEFKNRNPELYEQFTRTCRTLESYYKDMQDIEFTIEQNKLFLLQTRSGKRTGRASLKIALDFFEEGVTTKEESLLLVPAEQMTHSLLPVIDPHYTNYKVLTIGTPASFGVATGKIIFDAKKLEHLEDQESYILVCNETSPEYLIAMYKAKGIVTAKGGATSHAAVVTRAMGKPCIVGCHEVIIHEATQSCVINGFSLKESDVISINSSTGELILGEVPLITPKLDSKEVKTIIGWANELRRLKIRINADTVAECKKAMELGAEGIGLVRTEHMFFDKERILFMREMILSTNEQDQLKSLESLLAFQRGDFVEILEEMKGLPVTVRLLDPPLNEFMPKEEPEQKALAKHMGITLEDVLDKIQGLTENNPMLGLRGCRLGLVYPDMMAMQIRAIIEAGCLYQKKNGKNPDIEIMIPLAGTIGEVQISKELIEKIAEMVFQEKQMRFVYKIGTMIEIPRATFIADQLADEMEFFSFGTNDLTQLTFGYSRDDSHLFIEHYLESKILPFNPFEQIDQEGVGFLVQLAIEKAKKVNKNIKLGICGEHGGNTPSIYFFHQIGLDYVSCSTFRIPAAIVAAAQAAILYK